MDYLKKMKQLQLQNMVDIARQTHHLTPILRQNSETTLLIFTHPYTIDITFRRDELRFDVGGDSNIRYELTKK